MGDADDLPRLEVHVEADGYAVCRFIINDDRGVFIRTPDGRWLGYFFEGQGQRALENDRKRSRPVPEGGRRYRPFRTQPLYIKPVAVGSGFCAIFEVGFANRSMRFIFVWDTVLEEIEPAHRQEVDDLIETEEMTRLFA